MSTVKTSWSSSEILELMESHGITKNTFMSDLGLAPVQTDRIISEGVDDPKVVTRINIYNSNRDRPVNSILESLLDKSGLSKRELALVLGYRRGAFKAALGGALVSQVEFNYLSVLDRFDDVFQNLLRNGRVDVG